ncbi:MAG TPA: PadR family transcriptional regulator [Acidimicrobiales bacterium]|nr:PadR family transcriptional regulator [Acidimicrobiales bacterium]
MAAPLTTTSYAILGLLAVKPWTTYELAQQMQRALGQFWPRAESKLYEEPKKLVAHGLAKASSDAVGRRPRTVYSITPKGRRALAAWVPTPGDGPVLEFEQLVKVFFAEHGSKADLLRTIADAKRWSDEQFRAAAGISEGYLEGSGPFPERLPWLVLAGRFLTDFLVMVDQWSEWAAQVVEEWPDDLAAAEPDWSALTAMAAATATHLHQDEMAASRVASTAAARSLAHGRGKTMGRSTPASR